MAISFSFKSFSQMFLKEVKLKLAVLPPVEAKRS
jgi:hypothetical protein